MPGDRGSTATPSSPGFGRDAPPPLEEQVPVDGRQRGVELGGDRGQVAHLDAAGVQQLPGEFSQQPRPLRTSRLPEKPVATPVPPPGAAPTPDADTPSHTSAAPDPAPPPPPPCRTTRTPPQPCCRTSPRFSRTPPSIPGTSVYRADDYPGTRRHRCHRRPRRAAGNHPRTQLRRMRDPSTGLPPSLPRSPQRPHHPRRYSTSKAGRH